MSNSGSDAQSTPWVSGELIGRPSSRTSTLFPKMRDGNEALASMTFHIPEEAVTTGYDAIQFLPLPGDGHRRYATVISGGI